MADSRGWYNPHWHYDNEPETRAALDLIFTDHFSRNEPGIFEPIRETLLTSGDYYMHLADLTAYLEADRRLLALYADPDGVGAQGDPERRRLRQVLQRPHDRRVRGRDLGRETMPSALMDDPARTRPCLRAPRPTGNQFTPGSDAVPRRGELLRVLEACHRGRAAALRSRRRRPPARVIRIDPASNRTVPLLARRSFRACMAGQIYGYRVEGPCGPASGLRFDPAKVLLDPYGRGVVVPDGYSRDAASGAGDNAATAMKSVVVDPAAYDWEGDEPLRPAVGADHHLRDARPRLHPPPQLRRRRDRPAAPTPA